MGYNWPIEDQSTAFSWIAVVFEFESAQQAAWYRARIGCVLFLLPAKSTHETKIYQLVANYYGLQLL